ncbi:MAG: transporter substrate-binding domain-containing protein, partial [Methanocorpusculum sp.]|nr:transporter substrate-binding domain-containing protein [Methanocorpusculum sp.]
VAGIAAADKNTVVEPFSNIDDAFSALKAGKIDCVVVDSETAEYYAVFGTGLRIVDDKAFKSEKYAFAVNKDDAELLEKVNKALAELSDDGTLDKIIKYYKGHEEGEKYIPADGAKYTGELKVALSANTPPYTFKDGNETIGIDIDLLQAVADKLGCKLVINEMTFDQLLDSVKSGESDLAASAITITDDRLKDVNFAEPYASGEQVIVVRAKNIAGYDDLVGAKIGVGATTTGDTLMTAIADSDKGTLIERFDKTSDALYALKAGKIDCFVTDSETAPAFVTEGSGLKIIEDKVFLDEKSAFAVNKEKADLLKQINTALAELKADGTLDKILKYYHGQAGGEKYTPADGVKYTGELKLAVEAESPPFVFNDGEKLTGIDIDLMQAIADKLGCKLVIKEMNFDEIIDSVKSGESDVGAAALSITEDRLKDVNFTDSYTSSKQVIVIKA